ncbi:MAG: hypothetical protein J7K34_08685 [Flavobacteriaceae bacterium]|nr:hypothetical protein [Flavobacteriaceae bacterium]
MKLKTIILAIALLFIFKTDAQNTSVEKSIFGIQTGFLGIWAHNEVRLSDEIVLRSEIGFDGGFRSSDFYGYNYYVFAFVITAEPRWYYNLEKRNKKGKNIAKNSGNFIGIKTSFHPDWFTISNEDNIKVTPQILFIPKWGIKRTIGNHFTYEAGIGLGYQYIFYKSEGYAENEGALSADLHLRIGYTF